MTAMSSRSGRDRSTPSVRSSQEVKLSKSKLSPCANSGTIPFFEGQRRGCVPLAFCCPRPEALGRQVAEALGHFFGFAQVQIAGIEPE